MTHWAAIHYLLQNAPTTPCKLLHVRQTFRNFAIVKQNIKNYALDRKKFFLGQDGEF